MKRNILYITVIFSLLFITSCRDEEPAVYNPKDYSKNSYSDIFEAFWTGMNNNYVFWSVDKTDWDGVYKKYKPLFAQLDENEEAEGNSEEQNLLQAHAYFKEMTADIVDSHYALSFFDPVLAQMAISPSNNRRMKDPDYHNPIPMRHYYNVIPEKYLDRGALKATTENDDDPNNPNYIVSGTIGGKILYLHFDSFNLSTWIATPGKMQTVLDNFLTQVTNNKDIEGIIIDVRDNGGGDMRDLNLLIGSMVTQKHVFGEARSKQGDGRLDYGPWVPAYVTPNNIAVDIKVPIIALANQNSVSMAEITTMAVNSLPNGITVGERTWGGNGPLTENIIYSAGQFETRFMSVYTSSMMLKYEDGKIYEGIGFTPQEVVKHDQTAIARGEDPQLEKAIELIKAKK